MFTFLGRMLAITLTVIALHHLPWNFGMNQWLDAAEAAPPQIALNLTAGVSKIVLPNGLKVLMKEVKTAPVVTVQVWYPVGSQNERPGITGISHQLEHLMFKGTSTRPIQFGRLFSALGSESNAFTSYDMTAYYGVVGKDKLDALLELEADRMVNTSTAAAALQSERTVVLSELDGNNNNPGTRLFQAVMAAGFPNSSYGWPVIGFRKDVENFTIEAVQEHYRQFYRPDRATLVVVGDFDREKTLRKIKDTFGKITPPVVSTPSKVTTLPKNTDASVLPAQPIILKEPGSNPFLQILYTQLPKIGETDVAAIDVMDTILASGKTSRFYQSLVQSGIASSVSGSASSLKAAGWYLISATPAEGKSLPDLRAKLQQEINRLQEKGISAAELASGKNQLRAGYILNNRNIKSQGLQLGYNEAIAGDYQYSDRYLLELAKVTIADVKRVAQKYLQRSVVGYFEPTISTATASSPTPQSIQHQSYAPATPVDPQEVKQYLPVQALQPPAPTTVPTTSHRFKLANGLTVLLLPDRSTPTVTIAGDIRAGSEFDSVDKAGLAGLVAQNLRSGTISQDSLALATELEKRGASLNFAAHREGVSLGGVSLREDLPILLGQLANVLQRSTFPEKELELSRQRNLVSLKAELDNPGSLARRIFQQTLYPLGHPFNALRTATSLQAITKEDVTAFYRRFYRPETTTLTLVGDFDPISLKSLISQLFQDWQAPGTLPTRQFPEVTLPPEITRQQVTLSGKTQAVTLLGHPAIARTDRDYYAALLLNQVLGGDTLTSRLGTEIRDRRGLTYGIFSLFQTGRERGPFFIQLQTNPKDVTEAIESTLAVIRQVQSEGITANELEAAQNALINGFPVDLADPSALARIMLTDQLYGLPMGDFYQFPQRIAALSQARVNEAARSLLHPDQMLIVTATSVKR